MIHLRLFAGLADFFMIVSFLAAGHFLTGVHGRPEWPMFVLFRAVGVLCNVAQTGAWMAITRRRTAE